VSGRSIFGRKDRTADLEVGRTRRRPSAPACPGASLTTSRLRAQAALAAASARQDPGPARRWSRGWAAGPTSAAARRSRTEEEDELFGSGSRSATALSEVAGKSVLRSSAAPRAYGMCGSSPDATDLRERRREREIPERRSRDTTWTGRRAAGRRGQGRGGARGTSGGTVPRKGAKAGAGAKPRKKRRRREGAAPAPRSKPPRGLDGGLTYRRRRPRRLQAALSSRGGGGGSG
jgi:hypothetical protein